MRRIYDSRSLDRSDEDPYRPNERDQTERPRASRTIPSGTLSDIFVPHWLRYRGISISITSPEASYEPGQPIPFTVTMHNRFPFPVSIPTRSPLLWYWSVDGHREASQVFEESSGDAGTISFDRGERKEITQRWDQHIRISDTEWEPCKPGTYTLRAVVNVAKPDSVGLCAETTVTIE